MTGNLWLVNSQTTLEITGNRNEMTANTREWLHVFKKLNKPRSLVRRIEQHSFASETAVLKVSLDTICKVLMLTRTYKHYLCVVGWKKCLTLCSSIFQGRHCQTAHQQKGRCYIAWWGKLICVPLPIIVYVLKKHPSQTVIIQIKTCVAY